MEECLGWAIAIIAGIALLIYLLGLALAAIYWLLAVICYWVLAILDIPLGSVFGLWLPASVGWAVWGALIGGALGLWTIAPIYGLRQRRRLIVAAPLTLMVLSIVITECVR